MARGQRLTLVVQEDEVADLVEIGQYVLEVCRATIWICSALQTSFCQACQLRVGGSDLHGADHLCLRSRPRPIAQPRRRGVESTLLRVC